MTMSLIQAFLLLALQAPVEVTPTVNVTPSPPDWRTLGNTQGIVIDWDAANIERGETLILRTRFTPPNPRPGPYAYAITLVELRCAPAEAHAIRTVNYYADGRAGRRDDVPQPFVAIPDGTFFASLHRLVC